MDLRKLKTLIDLVSESNISELEITEAEGKVRIVKAGAPAAVAIPAAVAPIVAHAVPAAVPAAAAAATAPPAPADTPAEPAVRTIKSPMVGTFYRSSSPGGKPIVEIGSTVQAGDPVCIIEAMKIMNEIEADTAGRITQILVENGQAVEFGQPLFAVE
jgi:acetyl-CoA carboxylase biotin carboxyl carrier protein